MLKFCLEFFIPRLTTGFRVFHLSIVAVELHLVWPLSADLPGTGNSNRRFLSLVSTALQVMEALIKRFYHGKVVVRRNKYFVVRK